MVPLPSAESLDALTRMLIERCEQIGRREHYRKHEAMSLLFNEDKAHMLALPGIGFDAVRWQTRHSDNLGVIHVDQVRYLVGAKYHNMSVHVGLRAQDVEIRSTEGTSIVRLPRVYGASERTVADPVSILPVLVRKPRSWGESTLRSDFPDSVRTCLDTLPERERSRLLAAITRSARANGFAATIQACGLIIDQGRDLEFTGIDQTAKRIGQGGQEPHGPDLTRYDRFMKETSV